MKHCMPKICDTSLVIVTVVCALVVLPIAVVLYLIPSVRGAFDQLAYEDAMRG